MRFVITIPANSTPLETANDLRNEFVRSAKVRAEAAFRSAAMLQSVKSKARREAEAYALNELANHWEKVEFETKPEAK